MKNERILDALRLIILTMENNNYTIKEINPSIDYILNNLSEVNIVEIKLSDDISIKIRREV